MHILIRKAAAFGWSVEQAISGWDSEIDKLNGIPATGVGGGFLANIRDILEEANYDLDESKSLAAGEAIACGFGASLLAWGLYSISWLWHMSELITTTVEGMDCALSTLYWAGVRETKEPSTREPRIVLAFQTTTCSPKQVILAPSSIKVCQPAPVGSQKDPHSATTSPHDAGQDVPEPLFRPSNANAAV
ncbi:hypothetical protein B0J13DRAFT_528373 [Dactylonectria estremocensis]|uniref:Uncharacterized protein n=1 Tax=Dactylonectria estremocensis TaxID=1079267 RepID=A0A9P9EFD6_9HYPO|nr:hypothetical protein B0J13DRAFT_528373 [Dactylonectria estremocensis]